MTSKGVSCVDKGLMGLNNVGECKSALTTVQDTISDASFSAEVDMSGRPPGCYYSTTSSGVFWNTNSGGACTSCRSVCKGEASK